MGVTTFMEGWGGHAQYAYVIEKKTLPIPAQLTDEQAAGFMIGFRTAHAALAERATLSGGDVLVVLGAAGSTGGSAIQLGKTLGATVVAVASSEEKLAFCAGLGADHLVNYKTADVGAEVRKITDGHGADVIFDPVGGEVAAQAVSGIARNGRIAIVGYASGSFLPLDPLDMLMRNYSAAGVFAGGFTEEEDVAAYSRLRDLVEAGAILTPVGAVASFADVPEIIARLASPPPGKTVVRISD